MASHSGTRDDSAAYRRRERLSVGEVIELVMQDGSDDEGAEWEYEFDIDEFDREVEEHLLSDVDEREEPVLAHSSALCLARFTFCF